MERFTEAHKVHPSGPPTAPSRTVKGLVAPTLDGIVSCAELMAKRFEPLPVLEARVEPKAGRWRVWCPFCLREHVHAPVPGLRPARCRSKASPYHPDGHSLRHAGVGEGR